MNLSQNSLKAVTNEAENIKHDTEYLKKDIYLQKKRDKIIDDLILI